MKRTITLGANETARAIPSGDFSKIDFAALADEVADMAREEKRSLRSRLQVLISHLLKWIRAASELGVG